MRLSNFTKRQILTLIVFGFADFCNAICISLQAPFFPAEAEKKGASAAEYGIVFGVFELVVFLVSPWYGQNLQLVGPKTMFFSGILTSAVCSIAFGFLDVINSHIVFISLAILIRIIEALGNAAFLTASFAIIANEFPENVATTFASLETFFGLGLIAGPTLGGILYTIGGFTMPFVVVGILLFVSALFTKLILPPHDKFQTTIKSGGHLLQLLRVKGLPICAATIMSTSTVISFFQATLEPHLRQFRLTPVLLGVIFVVTGATYGASAPAWGWLCDGRMKPKTISIIGGMVLLIGINLIGPAPYMPIHVSLFYIVLGLFLNGLGIGARLVSAFTDAMRTAVNGGMPNDLETYGLISGLWTSAFAFGAFIGPTVSGVLYDSYGFANASVFLVVFILIVVIFEIIYFLMMREMSPIEKSHVDVEKLDSKQNSNKLEPNGTIKEKLLSRSSYQDGTIKLASSRVRNILYSSETNLSELTPLILDT